MIAIAGCVSPPAQRIDAEARDLGFARQVVPGTQFLHVIYTKGPLSAPQGLHVYLEGDGSPWIEGHWISQDPTPRNALMLRLMALDPAPSVYLGRPCYNGLAQHPPCAPQYWTHGRYSEQVVASMTAALVRVLESLPDTQLVFIGHSGGGTLAMLMAERFEQTQALVTIAGNLDPAAWAQHHGYMPLSTSLNPARRPALRSGIYQLHLAGSHDRNISPELIKGAVSRQPEAQLQILQGYDHACCWASAWPAVLACISHQCLSCDSPMARPAWLSLGRESRTQPRVPHCADSGNRAR